MMERLTFEGNFCDIAVCAETPGGSFCESGMCSQRKVWERLKHYEDMEEQGRLVVLPCSAGAELVRDGKTFKADHWNLTLTAFRENPATRNGRQVALFSIENAEQALKGVLNDGTNH